MWRKKKNEALVLGIIQAINRLDYRLLNVSGELRFISRIMNAEKEAMSLNYYPMSYEQFVQIRRVILDCGETNHLVNDIYEKEEQRGYFVLSKLIGEDTLSLMDEKWHSFSEPKRQEAIKVTLDRTGIEETIFCEKCEGEIEPFLNLSKSEMERGLDDHLALDPLTLVKRHYHKCCFNPKKYG